MTRRELRQVFALERLKYDEATREAAQAEWKHRTRRDERRGRLRSELAMLDADAMRRP